MIAEIYGKISKSGSNLHDRLEDQLTGNFFGTLRYLPFQLGLKPVLSHVFFQRETEGNKLQESITDTYAHDYMVNFWVGSSLGEIDVIVETEKAIIGIEVKYLSGLSSDDDVDLTFDSTEDSVHQLRRYANYLNSLPLNKEKYLILVAPSSMGSVIYANAINRSLIQPPISFGWLSWQKIWNSLQLIDRNQLDSYQKMMMEDLLQLLTKKGFSSFQGFSVGVEGLPITKDSFTFAKDEIHWKAQTIERGLHYEFRC